MSEITRLFNNVKRAKFLDGTSAFGGNASRKVTAVALAEAHRAADDFRQGTFWEDGDGFSSNWEGFKGCAVGCLTHTEGDPHLKLGDYYGIPQTLAHLADDVFEALDSDVCGSFPLAFMQAIPVGADLRPVAAKFYLLIAERYADVGSLHSVSYFKAETETLGSGVLSSYDRDDLTRAYRSRTPQRVVAETDELRADVLSLRDELLRLVAAA